MLKRLLGLAAITPIVLGTPAGTAGIARAAGQPEPDHARARLIAEHASVSPGQTVTLGLVVDMDAGWHVYWDGRNDTGYPVTVALELPEGWIQGPTGYPPPERHISPGDILDHIYEGRVTLLIPVTLPEGAALGTTEIIGTADWLVCREACIPGEAVVRTTLVVTEDASEDAPTPDAGLIEAARRSMPVELGTAPLSAWVSRETLVIESALPGTLEFYPSSASSMLADPIASTAAASGAGPVRLTVAPSEGRPERIAGIASFRDADGNRIAVTIDGSSLVRRADE